MEKDAMTNPAAAQNESAPKAEPASRRVPKTLHNSDGSSAEKNVPDIKKSGNPDQWRCICKASSEREGWMKSTKALAVATGCLVQVTTQQRNLDGTYSLAEAVTFVPGVSVVERKAERGVPVWQLTS